MSILDKTVFINVELIEHLKQIFPNTVPTLQGVTAEDVRFIQGQQSVIQHIEFLYEEGINE